MSIINDCTKQALLKNSSVKSVTSKQIIYTLAFKELALSQFREGVSPRIIWLNAGFNIEAFKQGYFKKAIDRWLKQKLLQKDNFGKIENRGRLKNKKFTSVQEELEYLRAENTFLKELHALEKEFENNESSK